MLGESAANPVARKLVTRANILLPGLYAWVATVMTPASFRGTSTLARVFAMLALVALVAGPLVALDRERLGRAIGVLGFVALCVVTWVLLGSQISVQRLDPLRAALGGVGWALFAFGWGALRHRDHVPEEDPHALAGAPLPARGRLPLGGAVIFGVGMLSALVPLLLAWRIDRTAHALFGHAVALLAAIAVVNAAAKIAVDRGRSRPLKPARLRVNAAVRPLAVLGMLLAAGLVWLMLK